MRLFRRTPLGFTLIELLVVMGVIAILMSLLVPTLNAIRGNVNATRTMATIEGIGMALDQYKTTFYMYPPDKATTTHTNLDRSAECVVYYLSGASIAYNPSSPPPGWPWAHAIFQDTTGNGRSSMTIFYQFKSDSLKDLDNDRVPEVCDPWMHRLIYNTGGSANNNFNQFGAAKHNIKKFDIFSAGPDNKFATGDDVKNWRDSLADDYNTFTTSPTTGN